MTHSWWPLSTTVFLDEICIHQTRPRQPLMPEVFLDKISIHQMANLKLPRLEHVELARFPPTWACGANPTPLQPLALGQRVMGGSLPVSLCGGRNRRLEHADRTLIRAIFVENVNAWSMLATTTATIATSTSSWNVLAARRIATTENLIMVIFVEKAGFWSMLAKYALAMAN